MSVPILAKIRRLIFGVSASSMFAQRLKRFHQRLSFSTLLIITLVIFLLGWMGFKPLERLRLTLMDFSLPLVDVVTAPAKYVRYIALKVENLFELQTKAEKLSALEKEHLSLKLKIKKLEKENQFLKKAIQYNPVDTSKVVTARILGYPKGSFSNMILIDAGSYEHVQSGQPVVFKGQVIGRTIEVGSHHARVLLLTDQTSKIPVVIGPYNHHAVLQGSGSSFLHISYFKNDDEPRAGDKVYSSGKGGLFPRNLLVGEVRQLKDGRFVVKPVYSLFNMDFVSIMYSVNQIVKG